jgi:hypothetical protein
MMATVIYDSIPLRVQRFLAAVLRCDFEAGLWDYGNEIWIRWYDPGCVRHMRIVLVVGRTRIEDLISYLSKEIKRLRVLFRKF